MSLRLIDRVRWWVRVLLLGIIAGLPS
jgi:hypothetical protein